mgnify:CR=1 FL=1
MRKVLMFIFGIILGFILGGLLMYGYWVYQDYMLEKNANEIYMQDECYQYHYAQLTSKQQMAYKKIYYCIKNRMDCVMVDVVDVKETEKIYYSVIDDHPEFYYVLSSFDYIENDRFIIFPDYSYTQDEINEVDQKITDKTDMIINKTKELNNIEKIKTIYQYIIDITEYNQISLWIKGDNLLDGYYNEPEENKTAFVDGWFKTGDLVRLDEDGFLYIIGRIKDIIVLSNGENVSPAYIEDKINSLDVIQDSLVTLETNEFGAEILQAEVILRPAVLGPKGITDVQGYIEELISEVNKTLFDYEQIQKVVIRTTDFPRSPSMKIIRPRKAL